MPLISTITRQHLMKTHLGWVAHTSGVTEMKSTWLRDPSHSILSKNVTLVSLLTEGK